MKVIKKRISLSADEVAAQLVSMAFKVRDLTHKAHLSTSGPGSYATHVALGGYYSGIIGEIDAFAEAYQGRFGLITSYPDNVVVAGDLYSDKAVAAITEFRDWIDANYNECAPTSELKNLLDSIQDLNSSTLYKLNNLA